MGLLAVAPHVGRRAGAGAEPTRGAELGALPRQPRHGAGSRAAGSSLRCADVAPPGRRWERDGKRGIRDGLHSGDGTKVPAAGFRWRKTFLHIRAGVDAAKMGNMGMNWSTDPLPTFPFAADLDAGDWTLGARGQRSGCAVRDQTQRDTFPLTCVLRWLLQAPSCAYLMNSVLVFAQKPESNPPMK